ncbi:MAG: hypothetical protein ACSHYA_04225 [Opitutaceae bacterium]
MSSTAEIAGQWFGAAEETGDYMGIRYGRGQIGSDAIEWSFVPHQDCDGIGGFARLLRAHGAELETLPRTSQPNRGILRPLWNLWRATLEPNHCAVRADWKLHQERRTGPSTAIAWHLFTEDETEQIRQQCRQQAISVNSYLLKQLDQAVRPDIHRPDACLQWMVPVNLRGDVIHTDDTANHVSYVKPRINATDTAANIQQQINGRLTRGEHRGSYLVMLALGKLFSHPSKIKIIAKDRTKSAGNIGAFSNLGVWDSEKSINTDNFWLFCPPVAQGQLLGAGCVSFQGRLGLTLQASPSLSDQPELANGWMNRWRSASKVD